MTDPVGTGDRPLPRTRAECIRLLVAAEESPYNRRSSVKQGTLSGLGGQG